MWTSTLDLDPAHVIATKLLGVIWQGAYFSSFAPLQVQNLPRQPLPAANWVRVRNSLAGICGSDLHLVFVDGDVNIAPAAKPGHNRSYPGHEVVGEVIEVGEGVQSLHVDDRVVLRHGPNCVTAGMKPLCRPCAAGNYVLCENGSLPGPQPVGGGWSEEMVLHEHQLFPISPAFSDAQAVLLEPASVAVHAVLRCLPRAGERVLIIGAGTIGLLILQVLRALVPEAEVHVMARHAFQVERAANMGAKIIYPRNSYQQVSRLTSARLYRGLAGNKMLLGGYDIIFDTIGSKRTIHDALRWSRAGGAVVMVGIHLHHMRIDLTPIWYQEVNLIGAMGHGMENWPPGTDEQKSTFEITAGLIADERIHPEELITQRYMLSEYRAALLDAKKKSHNRAIKVVFDFSLQPASVVPNVRAAARKPLLAASGEARTPQPRLEADEPAHPTEAALRAPETPLPVAFEHEEPTQKVAAMNPQQRYFDHFTPGFETGVATSSEEQGFHVASQYGGLPGFQPDLDQLDVSPPRREKGGSQHDIDVATEPGLSEPASPPPAGVQNEVDTATLSPPPGPVDFQPDVEHDYAWAQFITPQGEGEEGRGGEAPPSAVADSSTASSPPETSIDSLETAATPVADAVPTVKRARPRRKTADLRSSGRKDTDGQKDQSRPGKSTKM